MINDKSMFESVESSHRNKTQRSFKKDDQNNDDGSDS